MLSQPVQLCTDPTLLGGIEHGACVCRLTGGQDIDLAMIAETLALSESPVNPTPASVISKWTELGEHTSQISNILRCLHSKAKGISITWYKDLKGLSARSVWVKSMRLSC